VLVTGATGAVGPALVTHAVASGLRVRTLSRHPPPAGLFASDVDAQVGDIRDAAARGRALEGVSRVLHLAAVLHLVTPAEQAGANYADVNTAATSALLRDAAAAGVERVVLFSSIAVYGETHGALATEATPPAPATPYARSKLQAEQAVLAETRPDGTPLGVVLRLAAVYGPRVKGNYLSLVRYLASRRPLPILPGSNRRTLVFDDDVARAAVLASEHPAAAGSTFNVTDGSVHTVREIHDAICEALGRRAPRVGLPVAVARTMVDAGRWSLRGPLARVAAMVDKYAEDVAVDGCRIQRVLGFTPGIGLQEGWRRTVQQLRLGKA
jgi:nucleoside-diphosphate-sugar epimerase